MKSLYTLLVSLMLAFSTSVWADSPSKAELYEGIEVTVNINTATAEELSALLVGIGGKKRRRLCSIATRMVHFRSLTI